MPVISTDDYLTVMVVFNVEQEQQDEVTGKVREYIDNFISQQPGFISASLHKSLCGKKVVNYAQWESMDAFKAFGEKARSRPELPALLAFKPEASFFHVDHIAEA